MKRPTKARILGKDWKIEMIYKWDDDHVEFRGSLVKV